MDLDLSSRKLLALLRARVTIVIGDNLERLARSLELTPEDFTQISEHLLALGLAEVESLGDGYHRLAITDEGIAAHQSKSEIRNPKSEKKTEGSGFGFRASDFHHV